MNLYLDDDSAKASLVKLLKKAGHHVAIPADAGLTGALCHGLLIVTLALTEGLYGTMDKPIQADLW